MKLNLLDLLLPRETKFYDHFNEQMVEVVCAAQKFKDLTDNYESLSEDERKVKINEIKECEQHGDKIERKVLEDLNSTFITPFDRYDIHKLASNIDQGIDQIYAVAHKIDIYSMKSVPANVKTFAQIILDMAMEMQKCVSEFKTTKKIDDHVKNVHKLENNGDFLFSMSIAELFRNEKDAVEVVKLKDIYTDLENITDQIDYIGKLLRRVVIKMG